MRKKRFISWILTLCLLLGMFTVPSYAEGNTTTISGDGTIDQTSQMTITLEIPAAQVTTAPTAKASLKYNGNAQALVTAGVAENGDME